MFKFFDFFVDIIQTIATYIGGAIQNVIQIFSYIGQALVFLNTSVGALPPFARGAIMAILGISVASLLVGMFIDY